MTWKDVYDIGDGHELIIVHNYKVEGIKDEDDIYTVIPVTAQIREILDVLSSGKPVKTDKIIQTDFSKKGSFGDFISRAFTHHYKIAHPGVKHKVYKQLRKAQVTELQSLLGDEAYKLVHHSGSGVTEKHYIDKVVLAKRLLELDQKKK
jgi:hypothetical protein